ncbi:MAG: hypothetical protein JO345_12315 [Streptosporangiaceae bacterium]|nr:hypothetical protein [Streptosporangiaceae bacterium]
MSWSAAAFSADSAGSRRASPALATGRKLQPGVKPDQLNADELIEFWDDITPVSGRHAAPDLGHAGETR